MFSQNRKQPISVEFRGCFPHAVDLIIKLNQPISTLYNPTIESTPNLMNMRFLIVDIVLDLRHNLSAIRPVLNPSIIQMATSFSRGLSLFILLKVSGACINYLISYLLKFITSIMVGIITIRIRLLFKRPALVLLSSTGTY